MNAVDLIKRLHQHRMWANANLLQTAESLSAAQLNQSFAIGQGSIWKTLTHLYGAEYHWLEALTGNEDPLLPGDVRGKIPGNQEGENNMSSIAELQPRWSELDEHWKTYLAQLQPDQLDQMVYKFNASGTPRVRFGARCSDVLLHVATHAQYTTAQAVNMLRQVGVDKLPAIMLMALVRQEGAVGMNRNPIINSPPQGRTIAVVGDIYRFLATGAETDGKYCTFEALVSPGGGPPPHIHSREDESFFVLEGEITFTVDGQRRVATAGIFASMPIGSLHSFKNETDKPARMLISLVPAGLEQMFFEVGVPLAEGATTAVPPSQQEIEKLLAVASKYGLKIQLPPR